MRFWDSSAIVPLLTTQASSPWVHAELERDPSMVVSWGTEVECTSALTRLEREGSLSAREVTAATERLAAMTGEWEEVRPVERIRPLAARLLRTHPLRAGDAVQLAAAILAADTNPDSLPFMTLDDRLALAADREGFPVVEPA